MSSEEKLCFLVCWEDKNSGFMKNFHLYFYLTDGSVEMFDLRLKKTFLKKTENGTLKLGTIVKLGSRSTQFQQNMQRNI